MSLLDMFKKSKEKTTSESAPVVASLGKMWVCVVKFEPWNDDWYDVMIKNVDICEVCMRGKDTSVTSLEHNPFKSARGIPLNGKIKQLNYISHENQWVGFFDTKEQAEDAYRKLASSLVDRIESVSSRLLQASNEADI
jgi:hypothetical protein